MLIWNRSNSGIYSSSVDIASIFHYHFIYILILYVLFPLCTVEGRYKWVASSQNWVERIGEFTAMERRLDRTWVSSISATGLTGCCSVTSGKPPGCNHVIHLSLLSCWYHFTVRVATARKHLVRAILFLLLILISWPDAFEKWFSILNIVLL